MPTRAPPLPWLEPGDPFPPVATAWGRTSQAPGLLAAGGDLEVPTLRCAYANGIFPWFGEGEPNLWWSPDPRMVLEVAQFKLHRSLRKTIHHFQLNTQCEIKFDTAFAQVIQNCASAKRQGQAGTWIVPTMVKAYIDLHKAGNAHSVETWVNGELVGGLYCVSIGRAVFGESMFALVSEASKIALAALVAFCREKHIEVIDCQQNTNHLASMGAKEMGRTEFLEKVAGALPLSAPQWQFDPLYWQHIVPA